MDTKLEVTRYTLIINGTIGLLYSQLRSMQMFLGQRGLIEIACYVRMYYGLVGTIKHWFNDMPFLIYVTLN